MNRNRVVEHNSSILEHTLGANIDLVTSLDPSLGIINADPGGISRVILNLAVNARDAMTNAVGDYAAGWKLWRSETDGLRPDVIAQSVLKLRAATIRWCMLRTGVRVNLILPTNTAPK
jgi:signal transduction histidine kinase